MQFYPFLSNCPGLILLVYIVHRKVGLFLSHFLWPCHLYRKISNISLQSVASMPTPTIMSKLTFCFKCICSWIILFLIKFTFFCKAIQNWYMQPFIVGIITFLFHSDRGTYCLNVIIKIETLTVKIHQMLKYRWYSLCLQHNISNLSIRLHSDRDF